MLSPGQWHKRVPRGLRENLIYRQKLLLACENDRALQADVLYACKRDIVFYINSFVYQYNPDRIDQEIGPFILWDFQEDALYRTMKRLYEERKSILWEKSRELGATWLALILMDWMSLFHSWKKFLSVSHSEQAVDRSGDPDALFWKVDFIHQYLPDWIARGVHKRRMAFRYPATHSSMNGAASSERAGVGGRATSVLLDELSKQREAREIVGQTADTGPCLYIGTHYGSGTVFYELTMRPDLPKVVMHWSQHPEKRKGLYRYDPETLKVAILDTSYEFPPDYPFVKDGTPGGGPYPGLRSVWYDEQCRERDPRDVAMHLDIDPQGSAKQFFNALVIAQLMKETVRRPYWSGELEYEPDSAQPLRLTAHPDGLLHLWTHLVGDRPPPSKYVVGVDCAEGTGATCSCVSIVDKAKGEKVAEYADPHIEPQDLAPLVVALCRWFADDAGHGAKLAWEMPGPGAKFGKHVMMSGYANVYYRTPSNSLMEVGKLAEEPGWMPNPQAKGILLRDYKSALGLRRFINRSEKALDECLYFCYDAQGNVVHSGEQSNADPSGARINHGDRVIADALAWKLAMDSGKIGKVKEAEAPPTNSLAWRRQRRQKINTGW